MKPTPVIAVWDIGKTNKKILLFDEGYSIMAERSFRLPESRDEDGFPCEDLTLLSQMFLEVSNEIATDKRFEVRAIQATTYGASLVLLDKEGQPLTDCRNYLKPFAAETTGWFETVLGSRNGVCLETASPWLGNLNSGLQLLDEKIRKAARFARCQYALHLPQYLPFLLTRLPCSDLTSIGCHTMLWHFGKHDYHDWVYASGVSDKLAPIVPADTVNLVQAFGKTLAVGTGLHDSSAALIPYLQQFRNPFALISTGTWCITLNPFQQLPLTDDELAHDCLCYLSFAGTPVKAARLFAGQAHEDQTLRMAQHFQKPADYFRYVRYEPLLVPTVMREPEPLDERALLERFVLRSLDEFDSYEAAYHAWMYDLARAQGISALRVLANSPVTDVFVDGGFASNAIYLNLLQQQLPQFRIYAAEVGQATALGAAMAIHRHWNRGPMPGQAVAVTPVTA